MKESLTFLIPTYGNLNLLKKHLPTVFREAQTGDVILISEDKAGDFTSYKYFQTVYGLVPATSSNEVGTLWQQVVRQGRKTITLAFLQRFENGRFGRNVNEAVSLITTDYFMLLNNDVSLQPGVRRHLLWAIRQKPKVFAVGAREVDVNHGRTCSGRNELWWEKGRFWHRRSRDQDLTQAGATAWVCGGSGLYDTKIWRALGGFDARYYPAYWEDIDLSFTARRQGYQVLYEPKAVVEHVHETTNETVFGQQKMTEMSWRGGTKFAWKNSRGWQKLQFLLAYPYWQLKQFRALRWWWLVLIFALGLRLALLNIPQGLTVDEAAIAYNSYGIWTQRRDEWLNRLPVSFRSFGDYKAPLAIYTVAPFIALLGREIWVLRLVFVLVGVGSIWLMMLIVDLLVREHHPNHWLHGAAVGLLMTLLPWHLHYSHLGFENNFALFFVLAGLYFFLLYTRQALATPVINWRRRYLSWPLLAAALSWCLAFYSYHASKLMLPLLFLFFLGFYGRRVLARGMKVLVLPLLVSGLVLAPLIYDGFFGEGLTRANSSFLIDKTLSLGAKVSLLGQNFSRHFTPAYLLGGAQNAATDDRGEVIVNVRHGDGQSGVLTWAVLGLAVIFGLALVSQSHKMSVAARRQYLELGALGLALIVAGTIPAASTIQTPHSNQAYLALPGFILLASGGLATWRYFWPMKLRPQAWTWTYLILLLSLLGLLPWWRSYISVYSPVRWLSDQVASDPAAPPLPADPAALVNRQAASDYLFAFNLLDALREAWSRQEQVNQIIVSTGLEQEYIYVLLATGVKPQAWQEGVLGTKFLFLPHLGPGDFLRANTIFIFKPKQIQIEPALSSYQDWLALEQEYDLAPTQTIRYQGHTNAGDLILYQTVN